MLLTEETAFEGGKQADWKKGEKKVKTSGREADKTDLSYLFRFDTIS